MDNESATRLVTSLRRQRGTKWKSPRHVATTTWRAAAISQLAGVNEDGEHRTPAAVELYLREVHPLIDLFAGISRVDATGLWFYDGDGHIDEDLWREYLIPWHAVAAVVIHQIS